MVLFLSDLCIMYFVSVCFIVLCLSRFVFICFVYAWICFPLLCGPLPVLYSSFDFTLLPTVCFTFPSLVFFAKPRSTCHIFNDKWKLFYSPRPHPPPPNHISFSNIFEISVKNKSLSLHDLAVKATIG